MNAAPNLARRMSSEIRCAPERLDLRVVEHESWCCRCVPCLGHRSGVKGRRTSRRDSVQMVEQVCREAASSSPSWNWPVNQLASLPDYLSLNLLPLRQKMLQEYFVNRPIFVVRNSLFVCVWASALWVTFDRWALQLCPETYHSEIPASPR